MTLNSLVTTMAFHTYLAHVVAKANDLPAGTGLLFSSRNKKSGVGDAKKLQKAKRLNNAAKILSAIAIGCFNFWVDMLQCENISNQQSNSFENPQIFQYFFFWNLFLMLMNKK